MRSSLDILSMSNSSVEVHEIFKCPLLPLIYNYLYANLVREKRTCSALAYLTNKVKNLFLLFCPFFLSDRVCSLGIYVENCK